MLSSILQELDPDGKRELGAYLAGFVSERRLQRIREVLENRTRYLTVVLEDVYQPHNASAVLRSCDCFGVQDVHIVEKRNRYKVTKGVALGSDKWLTLRRYGETTPNAIQACLGDLRSRGYRIVATSLGPDSIPLAELPLDKKIALCFGTEETGLSPDALSMADLTVQIPMYGFTQSFNVSVCAAICLYDLSRRLREKGVPWQLEKGERESLFFTWLCETLKGRLDAHVTTFAKNRKHEQSTAHE